MFALLIYGLVCRIKQISKSVIVLVVIVLTRAGRIDVLHVNTTRKPLRDMYIFVCKTFPEFGAGRDVFAVLCCSD